jgi:hypothetical protein
VPASEGSGLVRGEHLEYTRDVLLQRAEVREVVADRVVDLVRDAGRHLAH